jgi:hypothetical protein
VPASAHSLSPAFANMHQPRIDVGSAASTDARVTSAATTPSADPLATAGARSASSTPLAAAAASATQLAAAHQTTRISLSPSMHAGVRLRRRLAPSLPRARARRPTPQAPPRLPHPAIHQRRASSRVDPMTLGAGRPYGPSPLEPGAPACTDASRYTSAPPTPRTTRGTAERQPRRQQFPGGRQQGHLDPR